MALLQARFYKILKAGSAFREQHETLRGAIKDHWSAARRGQITWEQAMEFAWQTAEFDRLVQEKVILDIEWAHYNLTHTKNEKEKIRKRHGKLNFAQFVDDASQIPPAPIRAKTAAEYGAEADAGEEATPEPPAIPEPPLVERLEIDRIARDLEQAEAEIRKRERGGK